jgi:putative spermidine/putrescine transport system permease protein
MSFEKYVPGSGLAKGAWTLSNYTQLVTDDYYREVIWRTLGLGFAVTFACLALGYPLAYLTARGPERWRLPLTLLVIFPMMLNLVVRSFGWIALLANHGLVNNLLVDLGLIARPVKLIFNFTGVMIGMTHIFLRRCHIVETTTRSVFVIRNFRQRRLPRTTRPSPRREACDVFGLKSDGVGR